jgi:hypothetical protein
MDLRFALCAQKKLPELVGSQGGKGLRYFPGAIGRLVTEASCFSRRSGCSSSQWFTKCLIGFHAGQGNFAVRRDMQPHAPDAGSPRQTLDGDNDLPRGVAERLPKRTSMSRNSSRLVRVAWAGEYRHPLPAVKRRFWKMDSLLKAVYASGVYRQFDNQSLLFGRVATKF